MPCLSSQILWMLIVLGELSFILFLIMHFGYPLSVKEEQNHVCQISRG